MYLICIYLKEQSCISPNSFLCFRQQILPEGQCLLKEYLLDVNMIFCKQKLYQAGIHQITAFCT